MKKINIQNDLDSRREISRMAYPVINVKETEVQPLTHSTNDQSEEETRATTNEVCPTVEGKKRHQRRASQGNDEEVPLRADAAGVSA